MIKYLIEGLLSLIFPLECRVCKHPIRESAGYSICEDCLKDIELIEEPYCKKCNKPLSIAPGLPYQQEDLICLDCKNREYSFEFSRSVGKYRGVLKECIHLLKYNKEKNLVQPLGELLIRYLLFQPELLKLIDMIIPVPLHEKDWKERGFNQSFLLSKIMGEYFSLPVKEKVLVKNRFTLSQVGLSRKDREKNIFQAFSVAQPEEIKDKGILIFDDVFTTGSTVEECAKELKRAGANKVIVLTLARGI
ncbi:MAG: ComF family protein [Candidatus Caldatribacteriota bacterium]